MQCHSVLGVRTEEIAQLANIRDLMEPSKHVSSPCRLSRVCTLLPSGCLIGGNHLVLLDPQYNPWFSLLLQLLFCIHSTIPGLLTQEGTTCSPWN